MRTDVSHLRIRIISNFEHGNIYCGCFVGYTKRVYKIILYYTLAIPYDD